jgi:pimeloyl-ACP methyl ester carboxylesterase
MTFYTAPALTLGLPPETAPIRVVWAHGWGQNHQAFRAMAESLGGSAHHILLDFPGFGVSPLPPAAWETAQYADDAAVLLRSLPPFAGKTIWAGHSFGCRVGIQIAARHPDLIQGLCLIAGAGLPRQRNFFENLSLKARIYAFKITKFFWTLAGRDVDDLRQKFGSSDYRAAGPLREIFIKVVREDLSKVAHTVSCPTLLIYGSDDRETPPEIGKRLNDLIPGSRLVVLDGQNHYSLLAEGRHQTLKHLQGFMKEIAA